jgi:hypothetical protein
VRRAGQTLHAEWTKLRTLAGTGWLLLGMVVATSGVSLPLSPWAGLGVLAAWAGGALLAGGLVLRGRDA